MSENVGASTSRNPNDLHGLYRYEFTFFTFTFNKISWALSLKKTLESKELQFLLGFGYLK
jgi:hypothetical protein